MSDGFEATRSLVEKTLIDPETGWDTRIAVRMVQTIKLAHDLNPQSWALMSAKGLPTGLVLNIGGTNVVTMSGQLLVSRDEALKIDAEFVEEHDMGRTYSSNENQGSMVLVFDSGEVADVLSRFSDAHEHVIPDLASYRTSRATEHQDQHRIELERITGGVLPVPDHSWLERKPNLDGPTIRPTRYRSKDQPVTGFWKQTATNEVWASWYEQGTIEPDVWSLPEESLSSWPDDRREFVRKAMKELDQVSDGAAHRIWMFAKGMKIGDKIFVHGRPVPVFGWGTILSDCTYIDGRHRRRVEWHSTELISISRNLIRDAISGQNLWGLTPVEQHAFSTVASALGTTMALDGRSNARSIETIDNPGEYLRNAFAAKGLSYSDDQIATFFTALQTKGFVVLSGISGTGKSKIAQGFADLMPEADTAVDAPQIARADGLLSFTMSASQVWVAIPAAQSDRFPPIDENVRNQVMIEFRGNDSRGYVILRTLNQGKPTLYITLGDQLANALREEGSNRSIYASFELDETGQAVERVQLFDGESAPEPKTEGQRQTVQNHLFLPVRPDWRDSTALLGYYNPLTETYQWTDILRFLLRAKANFDGPVEERIAWFVILDEMNLAHVEYYFADLLSVIESGRDSSGYSREPVRLSYPADAHGDLPPTQIHLPPNLYIIGTVNMDETTHAFSPKVLDRAFTIELTEVDFNSYPPVDEHGPDATYGTPAGANALLHRFSRDGLFAQIRKDDVAAIVGQRPEIRRWLASLNRLLQQDRVHFGYRIFDEIAQYLAVNGETNLMSFEDAFDSAVLMKVLPKFSGSRARLRSPLISVMAWALDPDAPDIPGLVKQLATASDPVPVLPLGASIRFDRVYHRASAMFRQIEQEGFISFG